MKRKDNLPEPLPYIVIILDELNDLMQAYPRELEALIVTSSPNESSGWYSPPPSNPTTFSKMLLLAPLKPTFQLGSL